MVAAAFSIPFSLYNTVMFLCSRYSSVSEKKVGKVISRGEPNIGVSFVNFKENKFSYLNITILGYSHVERIPQCSLACLETPTCFSYNLAAFPDIKDKLLCELLPSDKYNNSDKFISNEAFHHFSIAVCRMSSTFMAYSVCFVFFSFFNSSFNLIRWNTRENRSSKYR